MSYWNYSSNAIYSENKETIKEIHEKMKDAIKENDELEHVLIKLGIEKNKVNKKGYVTTYCNVNCLNEEIKSLIYKGKKLYYFDFEQDALNYELSYDWQHILEELYPNDKTIGITYTAHTSGSPVITRKEAGLVELLFEQKEEWQYAVIAIDENTGEDTNEFMNIEDTIKAVKRITGKEYKKEDFETETAFNKIKDKLRGDSKTTWLIVERLETRNTL